MADHEISKLMWIAVVVALAASIYFIARPQINTLAGTSFDNVEKVVKGIKLPGDSGGETPSDTTKYTVVGADNTVSGDYKVDLTVDGNKIGEYSVDSESGIAKVTFAEEAAKNVDLKNGVNIMYNGYEMPMQGSLVSNVDNILDVDSDGKKISGSAVVTFQGNQQIQIQGDGKSIYGTVITIDTKANDNAGSTTAKVTSHYEEIKA